MEDKKLDELTDAILNKAVGGIKARESGTRANLDGRILCLHCNKSVIPERINGADCCPTCKKPL